MIYFAQPTTGGPVKIGYSDDVSRRIGQLEAHYDQPLAVPKKWPSRPRRVSCWSRPDRPRLES